MREVFFSNKSITFNYDKNGNPIYSNKMVLNNVIRLPLFWIEIIDEVFTDKEYNTAIQNPTITNAPSELYEFITNLKNKSYCIVWKERQVRKFKSDQTYLEDPEININEIRIKDGRLEWYTYVYIYIPYNTKL